jgi:hypothetical protein
MLSQQRNKKSLLSRTAGHWLILGQTWTLYDSNPQNVISSNIALQSINMLHIQCSMSTQFRTLSRKQVGFIKGVLLTGLSMLTCIMSVYKRERMQHLIKPENLFFRFYSLGSLGINVPWNMIWKMLC